MPGAPCLTAEMSASSQLGRSMRRRTEADGSVVYTLRVASDDAPVVDAALGLARARWSSTTTVDRSRPPRRPRWPPRSPADPPAVRADADAFLLLAESFVAAGGPTGKRGDGLEVVLHAELTTLLAAIEPTARPSRPRPRRPATRRSAQHGPRAHIGPGGGPQPVRATAADGDRAAPDVRGLGAGLPHRPRRRGRSTSAARSATPPGSNAAPCTSDTTATAAIPAAPNAAA